jgi:ethanolamine utilization microcompartment shell protein EutS
MPDIWFDIDKNLPTVPINKYPLTNATDYVTVESGVLYNAAGMSLFFHFYKTDGTYLKTPVVPTSGGSYNWSNLSGGLYSIAIPSTGGVSINNNQSGFGHFSGKMDGILPFVGPPIGFRNSSLNNPLVNNSGTLNVNTSSIGSGVITPLSIDDSAKFSTTDFKNASVSAINDANLASSGNLSIVNNNINTIMAKLPSNFIMGSSDQTNHDDELTSIIGYVDQLETRLSEARAAYLDSLSGSVAQTGNSYPIINNVTYGLEALDADLNNLLARLTVARSTYLDNLSGGLVSTLTTDQITSLVNQAIINANLATSGSLEIVKNFVDNLESRLTETRAGYLDNLSGALATASALSDVKTLVDTLSIRLTSQRALYLDNLSGGLNSTLTSPQISLLMNQSLLDASLATSGQLNVAIGYVDELESRLTSLRASYLDNLSGNLATASSLADVKSQVDILALRLSAIRAGYLDNLSGGLISTITPTQVNQQVTQAITSANLASSGSLAVLQNSVSLIQVETDKIKYVLGLTKENVRMFSPTYDGDGNLTACSLRIYSSASDCIANTNHIAQYVLAATFSSGNCTSYTITKV